MRMLSGIACCGGFSGCGFGVGIDGTLFGGCMFVGLLLYLITTCCFGYGLTCVGGLLWCWLDFVGCLLLVFVIDFGSYAYGLWVVVGMLFGLLCFRWIACV